MNISICITILNEEETIGQLLDSLLAQTKKPSEIVIVDGGSKDKTIEIINHFQKRFGGIRLLNEKCSRAKGRNLAVEMASGDIIAMTDAGCVAKQNWLEKITAPFENSEMDMVAGFYKMKAENDFQKAEASFLGLIPSKFDISFLPSARSMAFRKELWEKVGGFPESLEDTAEDTVFNFRVLKSSAKVSRVKDAVVEWGMPETIKSFWLKIKGYAKGDAKSKIWFFPGKGTTSHNIKAVLVILRYILGLLLLIFSFKYRFLFPILIILFLLYLFWAFRKGGFWGVVLQIVSDFAVMGGFIEGLSKN